MVEQEGEDGVSTTTIRRSQRVLHCPSRFIESDKGSDTDDADADPSDSGGRTTSPSTTVRDNSVISERSGILERSGIFSNS